MIFKKTILPLLFSFCLIVLVKLVFGYYFNSTTKGLTGIAKEREIGTLFLGSSQTREDLDPYILEDSIGSNYILSYSANSFVYMAFSLDQVLQKGIKVKNIVLEAYPYRAFLPPDLADSRLFNELNLKSKLAFIQNPDHALTARDIYSLLVLEGNESLLTFPLLYSFHNSLSYKGGYTHKVVNGMSKAAFDSIAVTVSDTITYSGLDPMQLKALHSILKLCENNKINIIALEPPVPNVIMNSAIFSRAKSDLKKEFEKNGIKYLDSETYIFDTNIPSYFHDPLHLSSLGRMVYTRCVVKYF